jgi:hypothetical protein
MRKALRNKLLTFGAPPGPSRVCSSSSTPIGLGTSSAQPSGIALEKTKIILVLAGLRAIAPGNAIRSSFWPRQLFGSRKVSWFWLERKLSVGSQDRNLRRWSWYRKFYSRESSARIDKFIILIVPIRIYLWVWRSAETDKERMDSQLLLRCTSGGNLKTEKTKMKSLTLLGPIIVPFHLVIVISSPSANP